MNMYFRCLLLALLTLGQATTAVADSPYIWNGQWAKNLNAKGSIQGTGQPLLYNGQKNYVGNNSGVNSSTTGWAVSGATTITGTSNPSFLPGANIGWALSITNGGGAGYARYRFTVDAADYGKVLLIQQDQQTTSGYATAGSMSLDMYCTSSSTYASGLTRQALSTDSSSVTKIPSLTGTFRSTFSAASATPYCELRYTEIVADTSTLDVSLVYVGPGSSVQGAVVGPWTSFTPTGTFSTNTTYTGVYRRVGDQMEIQYLLSFSGAPNAVNLSLNMPTGFTINSNAIIDYSGASYLNFGLGTFRKGSTGDDYLLRPRIASSNTSFLIFSTRTISVASAAAAFVVNEEAVSSTIPVTVASTDLLSINVSVPVAEWAGSGTVNLAQNDIQYAYNTSTSTSSDTTSFGNGPIGAAIQAFAPTGTTSVIKRVQFLSPVPSNATPYLEFFDGNSWVRGVDRLGGTTTVSATSYGFRVVSVAGSQTQFDVLFYSAFDQGTGDTWSVLTGPGFRWRVAVGLPGQAVGFSAYVPGQSSGLVPAVGLPGNTSGTPACSGCVGERLISYVTGVSISTAVANLTSLTVPAGVWILSAMWLDNGVAGSQVYARAGISENSASFTGTTIGYDSAYGALVSANGVGQVVIPSKYVNIAASTTTTYYLVGNYNVGTQATYGFIQAIRIN